MGQMTDLRCKRCDKQADVMYLLTVNAGALIKKDSGLAVYKSNAVNKTGQLCAKCMGIFIDSIVGHDFFEK